MGVILDTSILIAVERGRFDFEAFCAAQGDEQIFVTAITASELLFGVERADTPERRRRRSELIERYLLHLYVLDFDLDVARRHATLWADLSAGGKLIGAHDLLIAATALRHEFPLATLNQSEFARVAGLKLLDVTSFARSGNA